MSSANVTLIQTETEKLLIKTATTKQHIQILFVFKTVALTTLLCH